MSSIGRRIDFKVRYPQLEQGPAEFHTGKRYFGFNKNICLKDSFAAPDLYRESFIDVISSNSKNLFNKGGLGVNRSTDVIDTAFNNKLTTKLNYRLKSVESQPKPIDVPYNKISRKNYAKDKLYVSIHNEYTSTDALPSSVHKLPLLTSAKQTQETMNSSYKTSTYKKNNFSVSPEQSRLYSRDLNCTTNSRTRSSQLNSTVLFKENPTAFLNKSSKDNRNETEFSSFLMKN